MDRTDLGMVAAAPASRRLDAGYGGRGGGGGMAAIAAAAVVVMLFL